MAADTRFRIDVLHEDEHLLFVDKPARMLTVPPPGGRSHDKGPALSERLRANGVGAIPVHRLDYETSGVVVFAKDEATREALLAGFRDRDIAKQYLALVQGWPVPPTGRLDFPIVDLGASAAIAPSGSRAITRYETLRRIGPCSLVRAEPETGRHNQIRLHFAHVGHPLVGERKFARGSQALARHKRTLLHAAALEVIAPHVPHGLEVSAPLPRDFEEAMARIAAIEVQGTPARLPGLTGRPGAATRRRPNSRHRRR